MERNRPLDQRGYSMMEAAFALAILGTTIFAVVKLYQIFDRSVLTVSEVARGNQVASQTVDQVSSTLREVRNVVRLGTASVTLQTLKTVRLDATGNTLCIVSLPNLVDPSSPQYDTHLIYSLVQKPDGSRKLYQRLRYYNGTYSPCVPAMAHTNRLRASTLPAYFPPEPTPGGTVVPYPNASPTPVPTYVDRIGRMPGLYASPRVSFDDASFFYDDEHRLISFGLTVGVRSASKTFNKTGRRTSLSTSVNLRRSE